MLGLDMLDAHLEGRTFIAGVDAGLADIVLFAFMATMRPVVPWLLPPSRRNIIAWFERVEQQPAVARARRQTMHIGVDPAPADNF